MKHFSTNPEYVETHFKRSLGETGLTKVFASMFNIWESILGLYCWEIKCREEGAIWLHWMLQNIIVIILALDSDHEWSNKINFFLHYILLCTSPQNSLAYSLNSRLKTFYSWLKDFLFINFFVLSLLSIIISNLMAQNKLLTLNL